MKSKTSISISDEVLQLIDKHLAGETNRSAFIELAVRTYLQLVERQERDQSDLAILNKNANKLNREAAEVLEYQAEL